MSYEQETLTNVTEARAAAINAGSQGPQAQAQAENMLTETLKSLFAVVENYPDSRPTRTSSAFRKSSPRPRTRSRSRASSTTTASSPTTTRSRCSQSTSSPGCSTSPPGSSSRRRGRPRGAEGRPALTADSAASRCTSRSAATGGPPGSSWGSSSPCWPRRATPSAWPSSGHQRRHRPARRVRRRGHRLEPDRLLLRRQDGARCERRAPGDPRGRAAALQRRRGDDHRRRPAPCRRSTSSTNRRPTPSPPAATRSTPRSPSRAGLMQMLEPRRAAGRDRPRDVAHPQLRHPLRDAGRHPRRDDRPGRRLLPALELLGRLRAGGAAATPATRPALSSWSSPSCSRSSRPGRLQRAVRRSRDGASTWRTPAPWSSRATPSAWRGRSTRSPPIPGRCAMPTVPRRTSSSRIRSSKKTKEASGVFDTHPPIQKRIAILLEMAHVGPEALVPGRKARRRSRRTSPPPPPASAAGFAGLTADAPTDGHLTAVQRLAVHVALRSEGAGQPQVSPRLVGTTEPQQAASEGVVRVVVVGGVAEASANSRRACWCMPRANSARPSASRMEFFPGSRRRAWANSMAACAGCSREGRRRRAGRACRPRSRPRRPARGAAQRPRGAPQGRVAVRCPASPPARCP